MLVLYGLKLLVVSVAVRGLGFTWKAAIGAGMTLAQVSEVSLFFIARAQQLHLVSRPTYLMMVSSTVLMLALSPFAERLLQKFSTHDFATVNQSWDRLLMPPGLSQRWRAGAGRKDKTDLAGPMDV